MQDAKRPVSMELKSDELLSFAKNHSFTERETDVFLLLANKTVNSTSLGKKLGVSHHTVSNHLKSMFQKSKTGNKAELLALFISDVLKRSPSQHREDGLKPLVTHSKFSASEAV